MGRENSGRRRLHARETLTTRCIRCGHGKCIAWGKSTSGRLRWKCKGCGALWTEGGRLPGRPEKERVTTVSELKTRDGKDPEDWQMLLLEEQSELEDKCKVIAAFLMSEKMAGDSISSLEKQLLRKQFSYMVQYLEVLTNRIWVFLDTAKPVGTIETLLSVAPEHKKSHTPDITGVH